MRKISSLALIMLFFILNISSDIRAQEVSDEPVFYTEELFTKAQQEGRHIVIDVWRQGCVICAAQKPTLDEAKKLYPEATFLRVNFAEQTDVNEKFGVTYQSVIIVFKGKEEVGRLQSVTDRVQLLDLIAKGA